MVMQLGYEKKTVVDLFGEISVVRVLDNRRRKKEDEI